jgi:peptidoglycan/xylan/chitin deacetylase (PgdA/CDA1 family)
MAERRPRRCLGRAQYRVLPVRKPGASLAAKRGDIVPDPMNQAWRDYGLRVGIWRMMEVMEKHSISGTVALNSDICRECPQIIEAGRKLGWEWMGHGTSNSLTLTNLSREDEVGHISECIEVLRQATGKAPRGWVTPGMAESLNTPDILAELGIDYVGDWPADDQPYEMKVTSGRLVALPYTIEVNDIPHFLALHQSPEDFYRLIVEHFEVLYEEGAKSGRLMAIGLHPFLIGQPHRIRTLDRALAHLKGHKDVWFATGSEIVDWYKANCTPVG